MWIVPLHRRLDAVAQCARWAFETWGSCRVDGPEAAAALWRRELADDGLPWRWAALSRDDEVLGMASLVTHDLAARPDLSPWLADVYVAPAHRRRGIASQLVATVEAAAAAHGVATLYLHTATAEDLYVRLGWHRIGDAHDDRGDPVAVMAKSLSGDRAGTP